MWAVGLLISLLVLGIVVNLQQLGLMQYLEFPAYDWMIRRRPPAMPDDPRIVIVAITENDIHSPGLDYPIWDDKMAQLLQQIEAQQPRVIGLDIYRDMPVPKSGELHRNLYATLRTNGNIVCIWSIGDNHSPEIGPPAAVRDLAGRSGSNDLVPDFDGTIRRAALFQDYHSEVVECFPLRVALTYLEGAGILPDNKGKLLRLGKTTLLPFEGNDGAYVRAKASGYQILHDFKGPRRFRTYTLSQALANSGPVDAFRNKIVLVGMEAESVPDYQVTPITKQHLSVELHALVVNQLLRAALNGDRLLRHWTNWEEWAWTFLWCLIGSAIGYRVRSPWRSCALIGAALAFLAWTVWGAFLNDLWLLVAAPAIGCVGSAGLITLYISYREERQRKLLMRLFATQVSPEVAGAIWEQREEFLESGRMRSQKLTATVLFADLKGFTAASEKLDPAQVMEWLNEYMSAMARTVTEHQGVVEKFIGDGLMAVFGVPMPRTRESEIKQDAAHAVHCALAMERELRQLNATWEQRQLPVATMRVGIHTGDLVAGTLGNMERMEYTVLGDTVNTASRLESLAEEATDPEFAGRCSRILISVNTWKLLDGQFTTKEVGTMNLKGKRESIPVYRVVSEVGTDTSRPMKPGVMQILIVLITFGLIAATALRPTRSDGQVAPSAPEPTNQSPGTVAAGEATTNCSPGAAAPVEAITNRPPPAVAPVEAVRQAPLAGAAVKIYFKPPLGRGSVADQPGRRRGGARGTGISQIVLDVLAPENTGLTAQESPTLFWYQSQPADVPLEVAVLVENQAQPVLRVRWNDAHRAGIQKLRLSDLNVKLQPGIEYEWVVALVVDPENRSQDVIASGFIKRMEPSVEQTATLAQTTAREKPSVFAEQGLWYDALESLSDGMEAHPENAEWHQWRASLLEQVGLTNAAACDRNTIAAR